MSRCGFCGSDYIAVRVTSRFCSGRCRKLGFRGGGVRVPEAGKVRVPANYVMDPPIVKMGEAFLA